VVGRRVLLLHDALSAGARPDEADVLAEAGALSAALRALGYEADTLPVTLDLGALERELEKRRPAAVVNLVESLGGRSSLIAVVPALLEAGRVPFTCPRTSGSPSFAWPRPAYRRRPCFVRDGEKGASGS
jgi:hypothetical protein